MSGMDGGQSNSVDTRVELKLRFQHFAPALGLGLRSKRGRSYGWRDNAMIGVHAKCEAKRTRGVDEAERWQVDGGGGRGRRSTRRYRRNTVAEIRGDRRSTGRSQKGAATAEARGDRRSTRRPQKHGAVAEVREGGGGAGQRRWGQSRPLAFGDQVGRGFVR
jgi:hypothetical protein